MKHGTWVWIWFSVLAKRDKMKSILLTITKSSRRYVLARFNPMPPCNFAYVANTWCKRMCIGLPGFDHSEVQGNGCRDHMRVNNNLYCSQQFQRIRKKNKPQTCEREVWIHCLVPDLDHHVYSLVPYTWDSIFVIFTDICYHGKCGAAPCGSDLHNKLTPEYSNLREFQTWKEGSLGDERLLSHCWLKLL